MRWGRVSFAVAVAAGVTILGLSWPGLRFLLVPATIVSNAFGGSEDVFGGPWFAVWLAIYAQLFFWALVAEVLRKAWSKLPR